MEGPFDVPPHLRQYVVVQDYGAYTAVDQAVWRFTLQTLHSRLVEAAHPAYAAGFAAAGISVEAIPRIAQMSECLARCGFGAVCVDGFIPPRAFQAFQARGLLPIAAEIRSAQHLAYTPAPDIIHEAAGHAPLLAHPQYAHYLRRIGRVGERAFANAHDRDVYAAVYLLSELKEDPASTPAQLERAQRRLAALSEQPHTPSEAALLSRLYWWTVEYGMVGHANDLRLYGAGLLSSLGEGHFCHEASVAKLPLDANCLDVPYDITRPQPQLFVARDFAHLDEVLDVVVRRFAQCIGGREALRRALESTEPACIELPSGAQLVGTLLAARDAPDGTLEAVELRGPCALAHADQVDVDWPRPERYVLPLGPLVDGTALGELSVDALRRRCDRSGRLALRLRSGFEITGRVLDLCERGGRVHAVLMAECRLTQRGRLWLRADEPYPLLLSDSVAGAHAALPQGFHASTEFAETRVPRPRSFDARQRALIGLYERAVEATRGAFGAAVVSRLEAVAAELDAHYPDEWLLRFNLLQRLVELGEGGALADGLSKTLEQLELRFAHREPIATGLAYLRSLGGPRTARPIGQGGPR